MPRHPPYALTNLITILNYPNLIEIIKNLNCFIATTIKHITLSSFQRTIMRENSLKTKQNIQVARYGIFYLLHRKEVIHPHVLVGIPCYDFTPITCPTLNGPLLKG